MRRLIIAATSLFLLAFAGALAFRWSVLQIVPVPFVGRIGFAHLLGRSELGLIVWRQGPGPAFTVTLPLWPVPILVGGVFLTTLW